MEPYLGGNKVARGENLSFLSYLFALYYKHCQSAFYMEDFELQFPAIAALLLISKKHETTLYRKARRFNDTEDHFKVE